MITAQTTEAPRNPKTVVLGVGASVSAFKAVDVMRFLTSQPGIDVWVSPTKESLHFVGKATWESLSAHPVHIDVFEDTDRIPHVTLADRADLLVIVGASADLMARLRIGRADEFLTLLALSVTCPKIIAPAMHPSMWENPATQDNVRVLRDRSWQFLGPESGRLADNTSGVGRLTDPSVISSAVLEALNLPVPDGLS